ncbi:hypothetical protein J3458_004877 [Metarhizium acridum]|uniref:uncharacterized protein n=1 Tax=Metarhizium acridum TaxID=92637 RepID=UPI001C6AD508|nr:hypothetical protein J3458_004877 [Metarhizium acridum]
MTELLLDNGAIIEAEHEYGETPLWRAAGYGCESTVKLLIDRGANIEDSGGMRLSEAVENGEESVIKRVRDHGGIVIRHTSGQTRLLLNSEKEAVIKF